jgi:hypothetical protein
MRRLLIIVFIGALALVALGCSSGGDDDGDAAAGDTGAVYEESADGGGEDAAGDEAMPIAQTSGGSVPEVGPRVIQTAGLSLSVPANEFEATIRGARTIAAGAGGFVVSSSASQGEGQRLVSGTLVVRVPEKAYAGVMEQLSDLGRVEAREEAGRDVSQELVDLEARIRHLEAVEAQLLGFLEEANSVSDALRVQAELNRVQGELEQARGRLVYLDDQVAFATVSLDVHERGVAVAGGDGGPWGIVDAWRAAGTGFVTVVGWIFVAAATIAPLVLLLALAYVAARLAGWGGVSTLRRPQA